jgi:hypothetical protein
MPGRKVSDVVVQLRPWKWLGFVVVSVTGLPADVGRTGPAVIRVVPFG